MFVNSLQTKTKLSTVRKEDLLRVIRILLHTGSQLTSNT